MVYSILALSVLVGVVVYLSIRLGGSKRAVDDLEVVNEVLKKQLTVASSKPLERDELYSRLRSGD